MGGKRGEGALTQGFRVIKDNNKNSIKGGNKLCLT
jgi:hypothetical protein